MYIGTKIMHQIYTQVNWYVFYGYYTVKYIALFLAAIKSIWNVYPKSWREYSMCVFYPIAFDHI
jgi:hypothetical protein